MAEADFQLLVAQARAEADNPAFKVRGTLRENPLVDPVPLLTRSGCS